MTYKQGMSSSDNVRELAVDAWRFALNFSTSPLTRSTPHIYMSALPFWPRQRPVSGCYLSKMQGITGVAGTAMERRKSAPLAVCNTPSAVLSVTYSFNGVRMASGHGDGSLRVWNAHTGQMVGQPLQGHTGAVNSVSYSHDGTRIVSGSDDTTIRMWDADSGQMVGQPLRGHTGAVLSVSYSHDGTRIVSGSGDSTIRMWDADTGQMVGQPLKGHTDYVRSVSYSHDGTRIVSGSDDSTIRMWDADTGQMVGQPLEGHTNYVRSVSYSHDGTRIVSGSSDKTIRIWDADTGKMVNGICDDYPTLTKSVNHIAGQGQPASDTRLALNPPSSSHPNTASHSYWTLDENGWVLKDHSMLLLWVPPEVRAHLLRPGNLVTISTLGSVALDFSGAQLGENWHRCYCSEPILPVR